MDPRESDTKHKTCLRGDGLKQVSGPLTRNDVFKYSNSMVFSRVKNVLRTCLKSNIKFIHPRFKQNRELLNQILYIFTHTTQLFDQCITNIFKYEINLSFHLR